MKIDILRILQFEDFKLKARFKYTEFSKVKIENQPVYLIIDVCDVLTLKNGEASSFKAIRLDNELKYEKSFKKQQKFQIFDFKVWRDKETSEVRYKKSGLMCELTVDSIQDQYRVCLTKSNKIEFLPTYLRRKLRLLSKKKINEDLFNNIDLENHSFLLPEFVS